MSQRFFPFLSAASPGPTACVPDQPAAGCRWPGPRSARLPGSPANRPPVARLPGGPAASPSNLEACATASPTPASPIQSAWAKHNPTQADFQATRFRCGPATAETHPNRFIPTGPTVPPDAARPHPTRFDPVGPTGPESTRLPSVPYGPALPSRSTDPILGRPSPDQTDLARRDCDCGQHAGPPRTFFSRPSLACGPAAAATARHGGRASAAAAAQLHLGTLRWLGGSVWDGRDSETMPRSTSTARQPTPEGAQTSQSQKGEAGEVWGRGGPGLTEPRGQARQPLAKALLQHWAHLVQGGCVRYDSDDMRKAGRRGMRKKARAAVRASSPAGPMPASYWLAGPPAWPPGRPACMPAG